MLTRSAQLGPRVLDIDGSYGEGGGQLVRTAVALAAITGSAVRIGNIRAKRDKPGLAPQHLAAVHAVARFCDAKTEGLEIGARTLYFRPQRLHGGQYEVDIGTAGSITLVLQALLPVLIAAGAPASVLIKGGTDVRAAPPLDYFREVLLKHLAHMGADLGIHVHRRGYYPRGGGEVQISLAQKRPIALQPLLLNSAGALRRICGTAHVAHLPAHIAERMRSAMCARLGGILAAMATVDTRVLGYEEAIGQGGAIVAWAQCEHTVLGAGCVAERGVPAEVLGERVGGELHADLSCNAALDVHAVDQVLVYLALAAGRSSVTTREFTLHAQTAVWLVEQFLPVRFTSERIGNLFHITAVPK